MAVEIVSLAPETPVKMLEKLVSAPKWRDTGRYQITEKQVFDRQYQMVSNYYSNDIGPAGQMILDIFSEYKPVVDAFIRHVLMSEDMTGEPLRATLMGEIATGQTQAFIRPLVYRSFDNCAYQHTPTSTGAYQLIPNTTSGETETATDKKKAWIILGWIEPYASGLIPYDEIQVSLADEEGDRRPIYPKLQFEMQGDSNIKVFKEPSPKMVEPNSTLDVDVQVRTANVTFGLWPLGVELIRADDTDAAGPKS